MLHRFNRQLLTNPHLFGLVLVLLIAGGLAAFSSLPKQEDPRLTNRFPLVLAFWPGAEPELLESLVIEPLEREIREESAVAIIESSATNGLAKIAIELGDWVDLDAVPRINGRLRDAVAAVTLPSAVQQLQFIDDRDPVAYSAIIALRFPQSGTRLDPESQAIGNLSRAARVLADRLQGLAASDQIDIFGNPSEEWVVICDDEQLAARGLTIGQVITALQQADVRVAAGAIDDPTGRVPVQIHGAFATRDRILTVPVDLRSASQRDQLQETVRIGDIARVERTWQQPFNSLGLVDGEPAVLIAAQLQEGQQLSNWAAQVDRIVATFQQEYVGSLIADQIFDQRDYVEPRLNSLFNNLLLGIASIYIVMVVLMGWRAALVVAGALPLTIGGLFMMLAILGVPLHQMSLFGMIIALGLLIDNAIVVVDEVNQLRREGATIIEAVQRAVSHLGGPLLASTLTTVASFTPIMLLPGPAGEFVGTIAVSVNVSLLLSLTISLTIIACWAAHWSRSKSMPKSKTRSQQQSSNNALDDSASGGAARSFLRDGVSGAAAHRWATGLLTRLYRRPLFSLTLIAALSAVGLLQAKHLGGQFFHPQTAMSFKSACGSPVVAPLNKPSMPWLNLTNIWRKKTACYDAIGTLAAAFHQSIIIN